MYPSFLDYAWESSWITCSRGIKRRENYLMEFLEHHDKKFIRLEHEYKDLKYRLGGEYDQLKDKVQSLYHVGVVLEDKFLLKMALLFSLSILTDVSLEQLLTRKWRDLYGRMEPENINLANNLLFNEAYIYGLNLTDNGLDEVFIRETHQHNLLQVKIDIMLGIDYFDSLRLTDKLIFHGQTD
jgi:hypothetical protein